MYYILYEGYKIESNEPVYCIVYSLQSAIVIMADVGSIVVHYLT